MTSGRPLGWISHLAHEPSPYPWQFARHCVPVASALFARVELEPGGFQVAVGLVWFLVAVAVVAPLADARFAVAVPAPAVVPHLGDQLPERGHHLHRAAMARPEFHL